MLFVVVALLLAFISPISANDPVRAVYKCSDANYSACFSELTSCIGFFTYIGESHRVCDCYEESFVCFNDCERFPGDHYRRCYELCPPPSTKCTPDTVHVTRSAAPSLSPGALYYIVSGGVVLAAILQFAMTYVTFDDKIF